MRVLARFATCVAAVLTGLLACGSGNNPAPTDAPPIGPGANGLPPLAELAKRLEADTGAAWAVEADPITGAPSLLVPHAAPKPIATPGQAHAEATRAFLDRYKAWFGMESAAGDLPDVEEEASANALRHVRLSQRRGGVVVTGGGIDVHFADEGAIAYILASFAPSLSVAITPKIDRQKAIEIAVADARRQQPAYDPPAAPAPRGELRIDPARSPARLAWHVELASETSDPMRVVVDAESGAIVDSRSALNLAAVGGRGTDVFGKIQSFLVDRNAGGAFDLRRDGDAEHTALRVMSFTTGRIVTSTTSDAWETTVPDDAKGAAVSAIVNFDLADAYFRKVHKQASFDGDGTPIRLVVYHPGSPNMGWDGAALASPPPGIAREGRIAIMNGGTLACSGKAARPLVGALDLAAHEVNHGITQAYSRGGFLQQTGDPNIVNEALSDVFGRLAAIASGRGQSPKIAEDVVEGGMRNLEEPDVAACPGIDHMKLKKAREDAAPGAPIDSYVASGIVTNAFWLMAKSGSNKTDKKDAKHPVLVDAMGLAEAESLWWETERHNLYSTVSIRHLAHATMGLARARTRYLVDAKAKGKPILRAWQLRPVVCAWVAVGVISDEDAIRTWKIEDCRECTAYVKAKKYCKKGEVSKTIVTPNDLLDDRDCCSTPPAG